MSCTLGRLADTVTFSMVDGPGNRFVVFLQGCNFDCVACHNPWTIPLGGGRLASVDDLVAEIRGPAPYLSGITVSGGEATLQHTFLVELFGALKADPELGHLTTLVDTNGSAPAEVWDALAPVMDGAMVDLKCLDPGIHRSMTGQPNDAVLASIEHLAAIGRLHEVRLLLVPGRNDHPALLATTGRWLRHVDPAMSVRVLGFRRHGTRPVAQELDEPTPEHLAVCAALVAGEGPTGVRVG